MRQILRNTIAEIVDGGGTEVEVEHISRHDRVCFTTADGRRESVLVHLGTKTNWRDPSRLRSQIRRKLNGEQTR